MRILFVDLETTGLDPTFHEIIEVGAVLVDERTLTPITELDLRIMPERHDRVDPAATAVNGYDSEEWEKTAVELRTAVRALALIGRDAVFCATNVAFDWAFLAAAAKQTRVPLTFQHHKLDIPSLAWAEIPHNKLKYWSLKSICSYLDIVPEPVVHRALNGAQKAFEVYKELARRREVGDIQVAI